MKSMICDRRSPQTYKIQGNRHDESNYEPNNRNLKEKLDTSEAIISANATEIIGLKNIAESLPDKLRIYGQTSIIEKVRILQ